MLRQDAEAKLEEQRRRLAKQGIKASIRVAEGSPAALIAKRAQDPETSLVVMGTHGRKALGRALLGSVAERVLRTAKAPVMTVRLAD
jgi:nucleotide-binding universal stress UspA family protein